jgi:hypothetical protein
MADRRYPPKKETPEPPKCWQCQKVLGSNPNPFFCKTQCGFDWAMKNAYTMNIIKSASRKTVRAIK